MPETELVKSLADIERDTEAISLTDRVNALANEVVKIEITDSASNLRANDLRIKLKAIEAQLDERRKFFVDPHNQFVKTINAWFKNPLEAAKTAIGEVNRSMAAYDDKVRAAAEEARLKILADKRTLPETKSEKLATVERPPEVIESSMGKTTFRIDKKLEIFDQNLIPRAYLAPMEREILAALKEGVEIPGARIIEVKTPVSGRGNF